MKRGIDALDVAGRRVFVRVDLNVSLSGGDVRDDTRIRAALPTITELRERGARVILGSHLGRPGGQVRPELSLAPVARRLESLLGTPVRLAPDSIGPEVERLVDNLAAGDVLLLENLRFHPGEEANDAAHAAALARLADVYVDDAFGTAHRAHSSTAGLAGLMPSAAGHLILTELAALERGLIDPQRPFGAVLGGAKVSDKIGALERLARQVDVLLLGGGMANTFLHARGVNMQASLVEREYADAARAVERRAAEAGCRILLPVDGLVAAEVSLEAERRVVPVDAIPAGWSLLDIGPASIAAFEDALRDARTVLWNGTLGVYELAPFAQGTEAVARFLAWSGAFVIVAGGDACAAANASGVAAQIGYLCTGGGATLEFIEGKSLPGVEALPDA
jgi:phosphoglycerate kinase